jgi:transcriptional regulator with XRE-family HTH domain
MSNSSRFSAAFAAAIKRRRTLQGLSQESLAEAAGVHHTYVSLVERGLRKPTVEVAEKLARALGTRLSILVAEVECNSSK